MNGGRSGSGGEVCDVNENSPITANGATFPSSPSPSPHPSPSLCLSERQGHIVARVHAFNILRVAFHDGSLAADMSAFCSSGIIAALAAASQPHWEVRNAASLCFVALLHRMLGLRNLPPCHLAPLPHFHAHRRPATGGGQQDTPAAAPASAAPPPGSQAHKHSLSAFDFFTRWVLRLHSAALHTPEQCRVVQPRTHLCVSVQGSRRGCCVVSVCPFVCTFVFIEFAFPLLATLHESLGRVHRAPLALRTSLHAGTPHSTPSSCSTSQRRRSTYLLPLCSPPHHHPTCQSCPPPPPPSPPPPPPPFTLASPPSSSSSPA